MSLRFRINVQRQGRATTRGRARHKIGRRRGNASQRLHLRKPRANPPRARQEANKKNEAEVVEGVAVAGEPGAIYAQGSSDVAREVVHPHGSFLACGRFLLLCWTAALRHLSRTYTMINLPLIRPLPLARYLGLSSFWLQHSTNTNLSPKENTTITRRWCRFT